MARRISSKLNQVSLNRAIKELEAYKRKVQNAGQEIAKRLAEIGLQVASIKFSSAIYDGKNDAAVTVERTDNGYRVVANGKSVCFIEFGTGVHYNSGASYPGKKPDGIVGIGQYGKGRGKGDTWRYHGDPGTNGVLMTPNDDPLVKEPYVITQGNPANMPMYHATEEMRAKAETIVREVFRNA